VLGVSTPGPGRDTVKAQGSSPRSARYELAKLGVATGVGWWPPREWGAVQIWRATRSIPGPNKAGLWFWTIALWVYWLIALALFSFVVYFTYLVFTH
jgi:hypothetical protein